MGELLAYIFYFFAASASPIQRRHLATQRNSSQGQIDFAFRVMLITFLLSPVLIIFKRPEINQSIWHLTILGIVCGIFGCLSLSSQYIAQRKVEAGTTQLLLNIYTPVTIILASFLLNERLKTIQIFGTVLLLFSVILVSNKHRLTKWKFDGYFWLMIVAGITIAFTLTSERELIKVNGITTGTLVSWGAQTIILAIVALVSGSKSQYDFKDTSYTAGLRFLQQLSWVVLITVAANLSVVSAITTFKIVIVFIAGALLLKEKEDLGRKIIGSLIAIVGLLLMV